jgi:hypothetical protein
VEDTVAKQSRRTRKAQPAKSSRLVLAEAKRPLPLPELFALAGYDRDSAGDVERFYLALRDEVGRDIEVAEGAHENASVELKDAS